MNFAYQGPAWFHDASNDVEAPKAFLQWQWLCRIIIRNHQGQRVWSISTLTPPLSSRPHTMNILACSQIPSCNCAQVLLCALLQRPFSCPLAAMSSSYFLSKSRCSCTPIAETQGKDEASLAGKNLCVWLLNSIHIHRCPKWIAPKYIGIKTTPRFFQWNQRSKFRKEYHRNTPRLLLGHCNVKSRLFIFYWDDTLW